MNQLRSRMFRVRSIRCDGYTATHRQARPSRRCSRSTGRSGSARSWIVSEASTPAFGSSHGRRNPIATNSDESGRRVNRRVFVTVVHQFVFRS